MLYSRYLHLQQAKRMARQGVTMPCMLAVMGSTGVKTTRSIAVCRATSGEGRAAWLVDQGAGQTERPSGQLGHEPARWTLQPAVHVIGSDPTGQETHSACSGRRKVVAPTWSTSLGWAGSREGRAERLANQGTEEVERPPGQSGGKPEQWTQ